MVSPRRQESFEWLSLIEECAGTVAPFWVVSSHLHREPTHTEHEAMHEKLSRRSLMQFGLLRRVVKEIVHEVASKVPEKDAAKPKQPPRGPALHNSISRGQP